MNPYKLIYEFYFAPLLQFHKKSGYIYFAPLFLKVDIYIMAGWATCYSGSNNIHFNFPPIMSDGRNYASWQPEAVINKRIQTQENIKTNWGYRQYMQNNGIKVMKYNYLESCYDLGLDPHVQTGKTPSSNVPYSFKSAFDNSKPGYGYCNSDLKSPYLTREQLNARTIAPTVNF